MLDIQSKFNTVKFQGKSTLNRTSNQQIRTTGLNSHYMDSVNLNLKFLGKSQDVEDIADRSQDVDIESRVAKYTASFDDALAKHSPDKCNVILRELMDASREIKEGFASYRNDIGETQMGHIFMYPYEDNGALNGMKEVTKNYIKLLKATSPQIQINYALDLCGDFDSFFFMLELCCDKVPKLRQEMALDVLSYMREIATKDATCSDKMAKLEIPEDYL